MYVNIDLVTPDRYHHGNLAAALLESGVMIVRSGGPAALTAREVTQRAGVSTAALYRHYVDLDQLRAEVAREARQQLAASMLAALDALPRSRSRRTRALRRFEQTGRAYIGFAVDEPHLFQCAFVPTGSPPLGPDEPSAWDVLNAALDDLLDAGVLTPRLREQAPIVAWTSVHGLASLIAVGAVPSGDDLGTVIATVLAGIDRALGLPSGRMAR